MKKSQIFNGQINILKEESITLQKYTLETFQRKNICNFLLKSNLNKEYLKYHLNEYFKINQKQIDYKNFLLKKYLNNRKILYTNFLFLNNIIEYMELKNET